MSKTAKSQLVGREALAYVQGVNDATDAVLSWAEKEYSRLWKAAAVVRELLLNQQQSCTPPEDFTAFRVFVQVGVSEWVHDRIRNEASGEVASAVDASPLPPCDEWPCPT
jgi:hypothetical protein